MGFYANYPPTVVTPDPSAATAANQVIQIGLETQIAASTASIDSHTPSLGQKTMANSSPVVIASDQSAIAVTAASLPLPSGAATSANQTTEIGLLTSLNAKTAGSLVPLAYDEIDLTYVPSGNGAGQVATAVYKLASSTIATLTMTYDGSDRLSTVVKS